MAKKKVAKPINVQTVKLKLIGTTPLIMSPRFDYTKVWRGENGPCSSHKVNK